MKDMIVHNNKAKKKLELEWLTFGLSDIRIVLLG